MTQQKKTKQKNGGSTNPFWIVLYVHCMYSCVHVLLPLFKKEEKSSA